MSTAWLRRSIRAALRDASRVRHTRLWPMVRPVYRLGARFVSLRRLSGLVTATPECDEHEVHKLGLRLRTLGFNERALVDLAGVLNSEVSDYRKRLAAWEMSLWYADRGTATDAARALELLPRAARGEKDPRLVRRLAVVTAECQQLCGDRAAAERAVSLAPGADHDPDLLLARANLASGPGERVVWLNRALEQYGISAVELSGAGKGATYDRLMGGAQLRSERRGPTVSVIVPAYNAEGVVATALESVLSQTWCAIEVLVVDDGSTDGTAALVEAYQGRDNRVRLIRAGANAGPYVARNLALRHATGELVTCNDADDWSHPERIEWQARHLVDHPDVIGNVAQHVRATNELRFVRRGKPGHFVFGNLSSLMFRRDPVVSALGGWDSVRFGADAELLRRVRKVFGAESVVELPTGPLAIARQEEGSLTADSRFGYPGYFMGARQEYREAYFHHHDRALAAAAAGHASGATMRYEFPQRSRPFAVPAPMVAGASVVRHFDVVIVSDFRLEGGSTMSSVEEIRAQRRLGLRTALVQMAHYDADPRRRIIPAVRELVDGDTVQMLVHGERATCDQLLVRYPPVLAERQVYLPEVTAGQVRVIVNQPPMSDYGSQAERRYYLARCRERLREYFGDEGTWYPIGPAVRAALHEHHADELKDVRLADEDWVNIIDVADWCRPVGPRRPGPMRIGRHSRDHAVKWPAEGAQLRAVYPDRPEYEVHVLGGGETPRRILGEIPDNWRVRQFGEVEPKAFLAGLDVFVYYTHPDWVESFGRVVLEAMAVGVPAILPESYRRLFSDAAIYAPPNEVAAAVEQLLHDPELYQSQVDKAQKYVERTFGYARHAERLGVPTRWAGAGAHGDGATAAVERPVAEPHTGMGGATGGARGHRW